MQNQIWGRLLLRILTVIFLGFASLPAFADNYVPVKDESQFINLVGGKLLRHRVYGIRLNVLETGEIVGSAVGRDISGTWRWQDGFFCREMAWGERAIPYNCQLVEIANDLIRFTVDRGAGDSAAFRLQ